MEDPTAGERGGRDGEATLWQPGDGEVVAERRETEHVCSRKIKGLVCKY